MNNISPRVKVINKKAYVLKEDYDKLKAEFKCLEKQLDFVEKERLRYEDLFNAAREVAIKFHDDYFSTRNYPIKPTAEENVDRLIEARLSKETDKFLKRKP